MILTEEEAKTKVCVETIRPAITENSGNGQWAHAPAHCIGSACMAWREAKPATEPEYETTFTEGGAPRHGTDWERMPPKAGDRGHVFRRVRVPAQPARGYCGKAGKP